MPKKKTTNPGQSSAAEFVADGFPYVFEVPSFEHKHVIYKSADVLAKAEAGDQAALDLIVELVEMGPGIVKKKGE
jgi:hypothetical protein